MGEKTAGCNRFYIRICPEPARFLFSFIVIFLPDVRRVGLARIPFEIKFSPSPKNNALDPASWSDMVPVETPVTPLSLFK
jgi:hypothetical protein